MANVSLAGGSYPVALDYFEDTGSAQLRLYWERLGPPLANSEYVTLISSGTAANPPTGNWSASYWNNRSLQGFAGSHPQRVPGLLQLGRWLPGHGYQQ